MDNTINHLEGRRILVTGSMGFLATSLINQLRDIDCSIIRFSRPGTKFTPVTGRAHVRDIEGDIRKPADMEAVLTEVDTVFHFSAQTSVYVAEENPLADMENNVLPMVHLLEICRKRKLKLSVFFAGTVTEVGLTDHLPVDETYPDTPITVYDLHKWMAENYLKYFIRIGEIQGAILRLSNVYGPGAKKSAAERGVLNMMIRKALNGETLTIYGKGDYLRDYVYVDDVVSAFLLLPANIERVNGEHFIIGSCEKYTIAQAFNLVADRAALKTGRRVPVVHVDLPLYLSLIETRNFIADTKRFRAATGWQAMYSLAAGVDRTIENYSFDQAMQVE